MWISRASQSIPIILNIEEKKGVEFIYEQSNQILNI